MRDMWTPEHNVFCRFSFPRSISLMSALMVCHTRENVFRRFLFPQPFSITSVHFFSRLLIICNLPTYFTSNIEVHIYYLGSHLQFFRRIPTWSFTHLITRFTSNIKVCIYLSRSLNGLRCFIATVIFSQGSMYIGTNNNKVGVRFHIFPSHVPLRCGTWHMIWMVVFACLGKFLSTKILPNVPL
jgi:hypothetical protein